MVLMRSEWYFFSLSTYVKCVHFLWLLLGFLFIVCLFFNNFSDSFRCNFLWVYLVWGHWAYLIYGFRVLIKFGNILTINFLNISSAYSNFLSPSTLRVSLLQMLDCLILFYGYAKLRVSPSLLLLISILIILLLSLDTVLFSQYLICYLVYQFLFQILCFCLQNVHLFYIFCFSVMFIVTFKHMSLK